MNSQRQNTPSLTQFSYILIACRQYTLIDHRIKQLLYPSSRCTVAQGTRHTL